jgi:hypothetical protein
MGMRPSALSLRVPTWIRGYVRLGLQILTHIAVRVWWGFVLMMTWNWFIPTTFHSAPHLGVAAAVGVLLVLSVPAYLFLPDKDNEEDEGEPWYIRLGSQVFTHLLTGGLWLLTGLIVVSTFM